MNARYEIGQTDRSGIAVKPDEERKKTIEACLANMKKRQSSILESKKLGGQLKGVAMNGFVTLDEKGSGIVYTYAHDSKYSRLETFTDDDTGETEFIGRALASERYLTFPDTDSWQRIFTAIEFDKPLFKNALPGGADSLVDRKALAKLIYRVADRNALMVMEKVIGTVPTNGKGDGKLVRFRDKEYYEWVIDFDEILARTMTCFGSSMPDRFGLQLLKAICLAARMTSYAFCIVPDYDKPGKDRFMPQNNPAHIFGDNVRYPADAGTPEFMEAHAEEETRKALKTAEVIKLVRAAVKPEGVIAAIERMKK